MSHTVTSVTIQTESTCLAAKPCGLLLPRLGVLPVFLPPRILKKPFPKDERAFLEPKLSSSVVEGKVAEGFRGGFSLNLLVSSLVLWKNKKNLYFRYLYIFGKAHTDTDRTFFSYLFSITPVATIQVVLASSFCDILAAEITNHMSTHIAPDS